MLELIVNWLRNQRVLKQWNCSLKRLIDHGSQFPVQTNREKTDLSKKEEELILEIEKLIVEKSENILKNPECDINEIIQTHTKFLKMFGKDCKLENYELRNTQFAYTRKYVQSNANFACICSFDGKTEVYKIVDEISAMGWNDQFIGLGLMSGLISIYERKMCLNSEELTTQANHSELLAKLPFKSQSIRINDQWTFADELIEGNESKIDALVWHQEGLYSINNKCALRVWKIIKSTHTGITVAEIYVLHLEQFGPFFAEPKFQLRVFGKNEREIKVLVFGKNGFWEAKLSDTLKKNELVKTKEAANEITCVFQSEESLKIIGHSNGKVSFVPGESHEFITELSNLTETAIRMVVPSYYQDSQSRDFLVECFNFLAVLSDDLNIYILELDKTLNFVLRSTIRIWEHLKASLGSNENEFEMQSMRIIAEKLVYELLYFYWFDEGGFESSKWANL